MESKKTRIFTVVLFTVYLLILIWIVLFKTSAPAEFRYLVCERTLNLVPFHYETEVSSHLEEVLLNALVFVPLGLYGGMLRWKAWQTILLGFGVSLFFEASQYALSIGAADVTDLLMNTAGAATGVWLYLLLRRICRGSDRIDRVLNIVLCVGTGLFLVAAAVLLIANN